MTGENLAGYRRIEVEALAQGTLTVAMTILLELHVPDLDRATAKTLVEDSLRLALKILGQASGFVTVRYSPRTRAPLSARFRARAAAVGLELPGHSRD
jgi:hypothetical protein